MKTDREGKQKLLAWQRSALEVANSIGYRMIDDRDVPDQAMEDIASALDGLSKRVKSQMGAK